MRRAVLVFGFAAVFAGDARAQQDTASRSSSIRSHTRAWIVPIGVVASTAIDPELREWALRTHTRSLDHLARVVNPLGEPLYRKLEPTGYSNRGSDWLNSASLASGRTQAWPARRCGRSATGRIARPARETSARNRAEAQGTVSGIEALHFHHVHLNSVNPKAAAEYYPKPFALVYLS